MADIKIGTFEFSKPPDIFQVHKGLFFLSGSLPVANDGKRLRELLRPGGILDFEYVGTKTRVIVGDTTFFHNAIWRQRYELLLYEHNPLVLTRRKISNGEIENIGEKTFSPRFKVTAEGGVWKETIPRGEILDYEVQLRVDSNENGQSFRVLFKDQHLVEQARCDFSKWTTNPELSVGILLGYLEQGDLLSVAEGKVTRISNGIVKSCNQVRLEGKGELDERTQQSAYLIKEGENLIAGRLERTPEGSPLARVKTFLLPDLKPKDSIDVCSKNLGIPEIEIAKIVSVTHTVDSNGSLTQFTFVPRTSA